MHRILWLVALGVWSGCTREQPPSAQVPPPPMRRATFEKGPASLLVDVGAATEEPLFATHLVELGGALYGGLSASGARTELWRTDGTSKGTWLVADLAPGSQGGSVQMLGADGRLSYFVATTPDKGRGVWRSDGTEEGTRHLFPLASMASRFSFATVKGRAFILVEAFQLRRRELWSTDGTPEGSRRILGPWDSRDELHESSGLVALDGRVYFSADDRDAGTELWSSDGTPEGTRRVKDLIAGSSSASPVYLTRLGGKLSFWLNPGGRYELWSSDGTLEGTQRVDVFSGTVPAEGWVLAGNTLFFELLPNDGGAPELWKSDGTADGTKRVAKLASADKQPMPRRLGALGGKVFFWNHTPKMGVEPWTSDGTRMGTSPLKDLAPGRASSSPGEWAVVNGTLYFQATTPELGSELWKTDGTPEGTVPVGDLTPGSTGSAPRPVASLGGTLLFHASNRGSSELWRTDGTPEGTVAMRVSGGMGSSSNPQFLTVLGSRLLFITGPESPDKSLWVTDGTARGTQRLASLVQPGPAEVPMARAGGLLYFIGQESGTGEELWKTDGTPEGTRLVKDLAPGPESRMMLKMAAVGETVFFDSSSYGSEHALWKSDGTPEGTVRVKQLDPDEAGVSVSGLTPWRGSLFLLAESRGDKALWKTDGTPEGTQVVMRPGSARSVSGLTPTEQGLYFSTVEGESVYRLWKTDGTAQGTVPLTEPMKVETLRPLTPVGPDLYFQTVDPERLSLWKTNGTASGTVKLGDWKVTSFQAHGVAFAVLGKSLYFQVHSPREGLALWRTDGTPAGTVRVKELAPASVEGLVQGEMLALEPEGLLLFALSDGKSGVEPWLSDGTAAGTSRLQDIAPGALSSNPTGFTRLGQRVFFSAHDGKTGQEVWSLSIPDLLQ